MQIPPISVCDISLIKRYSLQGKESLAEFKASVCALSSSNLATLPDKNLSIPFALPKRSYEGRGSQSNRV